MWARVPLLVQRIVFSVAPGPQGRKGRGGTLSTVLVKSIIFAVNS